MNWGRCIAVVSALALGMLLAGCGGGSDSSSDEDQIRGTVSTFSEAFSGGDASSACALVTGAMLDALTANGDISCEQATKYGSAFKDLGLGDLVVEEVTIDGTTAAVSFANSDHTMTLEKIDDDWFVSNVS